MIAPFWARIIAVGAVLLVVLPILWIIDDARRIPERAGVEGFCLLPESGTKERPKRLPLGMTVPSREVRETCGPGYYFGRATVVPVGGTLTRVGCNLSGAGTPQNPYILRGFEHSRIIAITSPSGAFDQCGKDGAVYSVPGATLRISVLDGGKRVDISGANWEVLRVSNWLLLSPDSNRSTEQPRTKTMSENGPHDQFTAHRGSW